MNPARFPRVAVLGVGGIGKHHARWWSLDGADVTAFLGRTEESSAKASVTLKQMFGFNGRAYTDLDELLRVEQPDIVDVCTPTEVHYEHAKAALRAGCHVLCEKPFVYDRSLSDDAMLDQARELIAAAEARGLRFGVCTQYAVATRNCLAMRPDRLADITSYQGYLVSPARGRKPDPSRTWVDLAPHMLGALQAACPDGCIDWDGMQLDFVNHRARATFDLVRANGARVDCDIITNHTDVEPKNIRRLTFNGITFDIDGFNDDHGVFQARIHTADGDEDREDAMRQLIRQFKEGVCAVPGPMALQNLEWMLRVLARYR